MKVREGVSRVYAVDILYATEIVCNCSVQYVIVPYFTCYWFVRAVYLSTPLSHARVANGCATGVRLVKALAKQIGGLESSFDANDVQEDKAATEEEAAEEEMEEEEEDAWSSDNDELVEEDSYEKIEGDVPRLFPGAVWDELH